MYQRDRSSGEQHAWLGVGGVCGARGVNGVAPRIQAEVLELCLAVVLQKRAHLLGRAPHAAQPQLTQKRAQEQPLHLLLAVDEVQLIAPPAAQSRCEHAG